MNLNYELEIRNMKWKHVLIVFLIGWALIVPAALFKILHWEGANILLMTAMGIEVIAAILAIIKLFLPKKPVKNYEY